MTQMKSARAKEYIMNIVEPKPTPDGELVFYIEMSAKQVVEAIKIAETEVDHPDYLEWFERDFPVLGSVYQCDTKEYLLAEINGEELHIHYLHQLQNIVHALAGQELDLRG